jgi:hypothetical protein
VEIAAEHSFEQQPIVTAIIQNYSGLCTVSLKYLLEKRSGQYNPF